MLVAMALSLIMMFSVVSLFSYVTTGIGRSRAVSEMTDRARAVAFRLEQDLDGITVDLSKGAWISPQSAQGYFEFIEGPDTDYTYLNPSVDGLDTLAGDMDDVLMFTVRNDKQPFVGLLFDGVDDNVNGVPGVGAISIESPLAEVVYWVEKSADSSGRITGKLYRQVRPIVPKSSLVGPGLAIPPAMTIPLAPDINALAGAANSVDPDFDDYVSISFGYNTLEDLTKPDRRSWRAYSDRASLFPAVVPPCLRPLVSPGVTASSQDRYLLLPYGDDRLAGLPNTDPRLWPFDPKDIPKVVDPRVGTDLILDNVKSFNVQLWDPLAPVLVANAAAAGVGIGDTLLTPSDYTNPTTGAAVGEYENQLTLLASRAAAQVPGFIVSTGAYVDLGWGKSYGLRGMSDWIATSFDNANVPVPHFIFPRDIPLIACSDYPSGSLKDPSAPVPPCTPTLTPSTLVHPYSYTMELRRVHSLAPGERSYNVYTTWPTAYEQDGIDQDGDGLIDEGTDGIDNDGLFGPDDDTVIDVDGDGQIDSGDKPSERETTPPYPAPIRGLKVTIRVMEPDSGAIHQTTVVSKFGPK